MEVLNHVGLDHLIHKISDSYNKLKKLILPLTYSELLSLRDNANLKPGQQYRIIDYVTTTSQENTQSAGHQFDVIVTALDEYTLSEEARACLHDGDTYFADSDLNAWQIWYCLDNDTNRFVWAGSSKPDINTYKLTIDGVTEDVLLEVGPKIENTQWYYFLHTNGMVYTTSSIPDNNTTFYTEVNGSTEITVGLTYDSVLIGKGVIYRMIDEFNNDCPYDFKNIQFKHPNNTTKYPDYYYTFSTVIFLGSSNIIEDLSLSQGYCYDNIMKGRISLNKQHLNNNVFLNDLGNSCYANSFEKNCYKNSFEKNCYKNSFGDGCYSNSFGDGCFSNSFGDYCYKNSFGDYCNSNSFGNDCDSNSFGNYCHSNSFGNNCDYTSFGNYCDSNSFGYYCDSNSFGNNCSHNSFGNRCFHNSFRISADKAATLKDYVQYNHFDDSCSYNIIWNSETSNNTVLLKNINVNRGVCGTSSLYNIINIDALNSEQEINVNQVDGIVSIGDILSIKYESLKTLRDNSQLIPGRQYRIIDYVTTTSQENTQSAGHQFDIIVTALGEYTLSEEAQAIQNINDGYFDDSNLSAWKIWYSIDNDTNRFEWAGSEITTSEEVEVTTYDSSECTINSELIDGDVFITPFNFESCVWVDANGDGTAYAGESNHDEAELVYEWGYFTDENDNTQLCLYKSDAGLYEEEGQPDYDDKYLYRGVITVDGTDYDYWQKWDANNESISIADTGDYVYATTARIVSNPEAYSFETTNETIETVIQLNPKGIIYRMIDEFNNDCPYDFKNIQFKHPNDTTTYPDYYYTFSTVIDGAVIDHSLLQGYCYSNTIKEYITSKKQYLNNNVFLNTSKTSTCYSNSFGNSCYKNSFGNDCNYNSFGSRCDSNSFGDSCFSNSFGSRCRSNSFRNECYSNSFGDDCDYNSFGSYCNYDSFGHNCDSNSFGIFCYYNSFGNRCYSNSFGSRCDYNSFGNNCYSNSFRDECYSNSFGYECYSNSFGYYCNSNSFGNRCSSNSFGKNCSSNSFGNNYSSNSFGIYCRSNSFGDSCFYNSFGNYCGYNSFGNYCGYNSFRVSADKAATLKDYVRYNHFDDSCSYNIIWNSDTTSSSIQLQNININRGVCGNGSSYNMINITVLNRDYEIQVYRDEGGNICIDTFPVPLTTNDIDLIWAKYFNGGGYGSGSASAIANDDVINSIGVGDYDETEQ